MGRHWPLKQQKGLRPFVVYDLSNASSVAKRGPYRRMI